MSRMRAAVALSLSFILAAGAAGADVKTQEKSLVKFEGVLGKMVGLFGGKAAKEGILNTVAVKDDRKMTTNELTGEIVDLAGEKVYKLDMKKKTYEVTTFAEIRERLEEARRKAEKQAGETRREPVEKDQPPRREQPPQKEYEVDFKVSDTGQKKAVNGFDCRQAVATVSVREKGKTLEQEGGLVLTSDMWLAPRVAGLDEIAAFDRRYAQKLHGPLALGSEAQMAAALAAYPQMTLALGRFQDEAGKLQGTAISTTTKIEAVKSRAQLAQEQEQQEEQQKGGGLGGLLARKLAKKGGEEGGDRSRATIVTINNDVLSVSAAVADADVALPAGFKSK